MDVIGLTKLLKCAAGKDQNKGAIRWADYADDDIELPVIPWHADTDPRLNQCVDCDTDLGDHASTLYSSSLLI